MTKETVTVALTKEQEARPVAILVQIASQFSARIYLECNDKKVNAKSIMGMMTLGLSKGDQITIEADGEDETRAIQELEAYLANA